MSRDRNQGSCVEGVDMSLSESELRQRQHYDRNAQRYSGVRAGSDAHKKAYSRWAHRLLAGDAAESWSGRSVLDPMCGDGPLAEFVLARNPARLVLGDISGEMLNRIASDIRADERVTVLGPSSVTALASGPETFDVVVISGGLHHVVPDLAAALAEIHRVLKPGGSLLFGEPLDDSLPVRLGRKVLYRVLPNFDHRTEHPFRTVELLEALEQAGFVNVRLHPVGSLGMLLMMNVNVFPFKLLTRKRPVQRMLLDLDRRVEENRFLQRFCIAVIGAASK